MDTASKVGMVLVAFAAAVIGGCGGGSNPTADTGNQQAETAGAQPSANCKTTPNDHGSVTECNGREGNTLQVIIDHKQAGQVELSIKYQDNAHMMKDFRGHQEKVVTAWVATTSQVGADPAARTSPQTTDFTDIALLSDGTGGYTTFCARDPSDPSDPRCATALPVSVSNEEHIVGALLAVDGISARDPAHFPDNIKVDIVGE